jgi:uncharacterized alpha-E superfamily protein
VRHPAAQAGAPSRSAENLFWLGRNMERLEDKARVLRTALSRLAGEGTPTEDQELLTVRRALVQMDRLPAALQGRVSRVRFLATLEEFIFNPETVGSAIRLMNQIRFLTASLRDRLSGDTWRILNQLQSEFREAPKQGQAAGHLRTLHKLIYNLAAFNGMEMENMTRGTSWRFLELGRRIERGCNLIDMIRAVVAVDPTGDSSMVPLLEYSDSSMTYRRRHFARPHLATTLDLLLLERTNPRSLAFQLHAIGEHLPHLPTASHEPPEQEHFARLIQVLDSAELKQTGGGIPFLRVLASTGRELRVLSDILTERFFSHVMPRVT